MHFRLRLDEASGLWYVVQCEDGIATPVTTPGDKARAVRWRYRFIMAEEKRQRDALKAIAAIGPSRYTGPAPAPVRDVRADAQPADPTI